MRYSYNLKLHHLFDYNFKHVNDVPLVGLYFH